MEPQTFRETLMLTILEGLMLRHNELGYSDMYALHEAYRLSEKWCNSRAQNSESEESCQLPTTKVKTPAEEPTPEGEICPDCQDGWCPDHTGFFGGGRTCKTCNGTGKLLLT